MNLPFQQYRNLFSTRTKSNSSSSAAAIAINQWTRRIQKHLWRAIDFLHIFVMIFALYTGIIVAILRNELLEQ
jgi:predicted membrane channel-forming protein YqfA (hemolysin III family)